MLKDNPFIRIYSFSYHNGVPKDPCGNGGGFVFDCRGLSNPGSNPEWAELCGTDEPIIQMLNNLPETSPFLQYAFNLISNTASSYRERGFTDLMVSFGCTGGRHRSVYCAERMGAKLRNYGFNTRVIHWQMEQTDTRFKLKRAMILAAGEGTRLRPLTNNTPKALIKAGGKTMLDWTVDTLIKAGFKEIIINTFHLKDRLSDYILLLEANHPGVRFIVSEEQQLLGTGGGIRQAVRWLHNPNPILIHNVDVWTDFNLSELYIQHNPNDLATVLTQKRKSTHYLLVDEQRRVVGRYLNNKELLATQPKGDVRKLAFAGIHIMSPAMVEKLSFMQGGDIIDFYLQAINNGGTVRSLTVKGNWFDMGTREKLYKLREWLKDMNISNRG